MVFDRFEYVIWFGASHSLSLAIAKCIKIQQATNWWRWCKIGNADWRQFKCANCRPLCAVALAGGYHVVQIVNTFDYCRPRCQEDIIEFKWILDEGELFSVSAVIRTPSTSSARFTHHKSYLEFRADHGESFILVYCLFIFVLFCARDNQHAAKVQHQKLSTHYRICVDRANETPVGR